MKNVNHILDQETRNGKLNWARCLFIFLSGIAFPAYGYIDPGTGSMLFSVMIGLVSVVFFTVRSALIRLRTLPIWYHHDKGYASKNKKEFVIYSEGRQYWNVFRPVIEELDRRAISCHFYTSDESDPGLKYQSNHVKARFIGKGNKAYAMLNMLEADLCLMTTPGLDVYQLKRSKFVKHYTHILHSTDDVTFYRLFGLDYFDSVLLTGEYQKKAIRQLETLRGIKEKKLIVVGCTYLDELKKSLDNLPVVVKTDSNYTVLVSPSWGENGILRKFGMSLLKPLVESNFQVIIRPHPQSAISEKKILDYLMEQLKPYQNVEWDFHRENIHAMQKSDIMISDFSAIVFDYLFLFSRPVIYTSYNFDKRPYDCSDLEEEPWKFQTLNRIGIRLTEDNFMNIREIVLNNIHNRDLQEKIRERRETAYFYPGQAGEKVVDAILSLQQAEL
ncbi:CDP-Glycerol:Poly(Glycerophosphate) glycerophosphotransferase [Gammaproteobacteria bacterium]